MTNETYEKLETAVQDTLDLINEYSMEGKEREKAIKEAVELTELLISADREYSEFKDKEARRKIEEQRNEITAKIEREKQELTWKRVTFELVKTIAPLGISLIGYNVFQKRVMSYEENGRIVSTAGRELHLPNFLRK